MKKLTIIVKETVFERVGNSSYRNDEKFAEKEVRA